MKLFTNKQQKSYKNPNICYICKEKVEDKYAKDKKYCKTTLPANTGSQDVLRTSPLMSHGCPMDIPWKILVVHPRDVLI